MIKYSRLAIVFECVFIFLFSHHGNNIILLLKDRCVEFIPIKLPPMMGESNQQ